jgi:hypothetical protein
MKNRITVISLILAIAIAAGCSRTEKPYRVGLVNLVVGKAFIIGKNGGETPAKTGMPLDVGMKIKTSGRNSLCEIYFNENAIKVFGDSIVSVERLTYNMKSESDETSLSLEKGRCFARVSKKLMKEDSFIVKTPVCVAAVRGTDFFISDSGSVSTVSCLDGKVEIRDRAKKGNSVVVSNKEEAKTSKGKAAKKNDIAAKRSDSLKKVSDIKPVTSENKIMFDRLDKGDKAAVREVKSSIEKLSGTPVDKEKKDDHNTDLFFFKS